MRLLAALVLAPALVAAAVFPKGGPVKEIDGSAFKKLMKTNVRARDRAGLPRYLPQHPQGTAVVAFVAPWCGVRIAPLPLLLRQPI
jgi:hypothetical protein